MTNEPDQIPASDMPDQNEPEINGAENAAPVDLQATRIAALEAEIADAKDKMMRALAEAENARRRAVKDREDAGKYAVTSFARDLLDFSDNFHRALAAIPGDLHTDERIAGIITGLEAMDANLLKTFEKHGIKKIDPLDEPFNPNFHEVMFEAPVPGKPAGVVIQVIESGYVIADRLLRAAKVGVSKGDGSSHQVDQSA
jgi:molecular chaperone GrpE